ncbi:hypothetical protein PFICI_02570 [Pestalotiopsis fici W106-1]|uniref:Copper acquisition factor BIM1-like domain-containing protein n=1 Tax=Pestalotiopsis fici (strain W106-1 / CGMCC3.15140) TaxID=1229662 RepID=W3XER8_PESFW|nr:uncharacterized protein PFICI_02570 [Pestalotiopsis fici W106-1]ETS84545.1 hypothetical protein PFICI_02570 [Pestalotiopsis fici W106-1]
MQFSVYLLLAAAQLITAHFGIEYPEWRADTLTVEDGPYSQYDYPCANVPDGTGNRTQWPLTGGAVSLELHHAWTYVFVNLGLGNNVTNFNISLTPEFLNVTGNGTFCLPRLELPKGGSGSSIANGTNASIQVVTSGRSGSALYNCADVILVTDAPGPADGVCVNTTQSSVVVSANQSTDANSTGSGSASNTTSGAQTVSANNAALAVFLGVAMLFATGMGI